LLGGIVPATSLSGVVVPALVHDRGRFALQDTMIMANALLVTALLTELAKTLVSRRRPAATYARGADGVSAGSSRERMRSFFSGHAALSCAMTASASTLAFQRGYAVAPYLALGSGAFALTTSILRIVADRHWATDVLAGVVVGILAGVLLPLALHPREQSQRVPAAAGLQPVAGNARAEREPVLPMPVIFAW
jgi:membrane-associated phospholipid phosphatase